MQLPQLRNEVLDANLYLVRSGLVAFTFGNASAFDRASGLAVIKPSGIPYEQLTPEHLVITNLDGEVVEGSLRPSSDLPTHIEIYRAFPEINGVVHTHSRFATAWAQANRDIPCFGTTHADYFHGCVPVTRPMIPEEVNGDYEKNTGLLIIERFQNLDPLSAPAVLVSGHAPFCFGRTVTEAAHHAAVLEELAQMAYLTLTINAECSGIGEHLLDKHFLRKHGPGAYYGQFKSSF